MTVIRLTTQNKKVNIKQQSLKINLTHKTLKIAIKQIGGRGQDGEQGLRGIPGIGIPDGGLENQVLQKVSSEDYDFKWLTPTFEDKTFTYNFTVSQDVLVEHQLHKYPAVTVLNSAGDEVVGNVMHLDANSLRITFSAPFSGKVICN